MKFIISNTRDSLNFSPEKELWVVETNPRKDLGEPTPCSEKEVIQQINNGEDFRLLYKVSCRWEVGPSFTVESKNGKPMLTLVPKSSES